LSAERLTTLYGLPFDEPNLEILMRHRAVLFGMLGVFLAYAAFKPPLQAVAFLAAFVSIGSFFYLAWSVTAYNSAIANVVKADGVAALCLLVAVGFYYGR